LLFYNLSLSPSLSVPLSLSVHSKAQPDQILPQRESGGGGGGEREERARESEKDK
jgi:hypothetical protein